MNEVEQGRESTEVGRAAPLPSVWHHMRLLAAVVFALATLVLSVHTWRGAGAAVTAWQMARSYGDAARQEIVATDLPLFDRDLYLGDVTGSWDAERRSQVLVLVLGADSAKSRLGAGDWQEVVGRVPWRHWQAVWLVVDRQHEEASRLRSAAASAGAVTRLLVMKNIDSFSRRTGLLGIPVAALAYGRRLQLLSVGSLTPVETSRFEAWIQEPSVRFPLDPFLSDRQPDNLMSPAVR